MTSEETTAPTLEPLPASAPQPQRWASSFSGWPHRHVLVRRLAEVSVLLALGSAIVAYALFFARLSLLRHQAFQAHPLELGLAHRTLLALAYGQPAATSLLALVRFPSASAVLPAGDVEAASVMSLGERHIAPALLLFVPLYRLWPTPEALLVLQSWTLALGAIPAYLLARRRLGNALAGLIAAGLYLLAPAVQGAGLSGFQPVSLFAPLALTAAYALERRWYLAFGLCALLALALREDLGLVFGIWGLVVALTAGSSSLAAEERRRRLWTGAAVAAAGMAWFWTASLVLLAPNGAAPPSSAPTWGDALMRLGGALRSVGYLALLDPLAALPALPSLALSALAGPSQASAAAYHAAIAFPFLLTAAIAGMARLVRVLHRLQPGLSPLVPSSALAALAFTVAWGHHVAEGVSPWMYGGFRWPQVTEHHRKLQGLLERLPPDATVSTQAALLSHLGRTNVRLFPAVEDADYVLLDVTAPSFPISDGDFQAQARRLLETGPRQSNSTAGAAEPSAAPFGVLAAEDGYLLLQRGAPARDLPAEFFTFARATTADVDYPLRATFGTELRLLGYDYTVTAAPGPDGRSVQIATYWQALSRVSADYRIVLGVRGANGAPTSLRDVVTPTTAWLPASRWAPGDILRITLPPLSQRQARELFIAVLQPNAPLTIEHRLPIAQAPEGLPIEEEQTLLFLADLPSLFAPPVAQQPRRFALRNGLAGAAMSPEEPQVPPPQARPVAPLCGKPLDDPARAHLRPIIVKIDNAPAARPPSGLAEACMVWEMMAEGGITRFAAIYHTEEPDLVGPVRSSRLIDAELGPAFQAPVAHVGGSAPVLWFLAQSQVMDLDQFLYPGAYWRSAARFAPHNVYTSIGTLRQLAAELGWGDPVSLPSYTFMADGTPAPPGQPAASVVVPYSPYALASYQWDPEGRVYRRFIGGQPHLDAANGQHIVAHTVLLLFTEAWPATEIITDPRVMSLRFRLWDEGLLWAFHDGQAYEGKWRRIRPDGIVEFLTPDGRPLPLRPGTIWVQVVTPDVAVHWE